MQAQGVGNQWMRDDEIDLLELLRTLWAQRVAIVLITTVVFLCFTAYAFLAKPVYQATATVLPPQISDIAGYNVGRGQVAGFQPYTVDDVYKVFVRVLNSEALRSSFFNTVYLPARNHSAEGSNQKLWAAFNDELDIKSIDKKRSREREPEHWQIAFEHEDPVKSAEWLNHFVAMASEMAKATLHKDAAGELFIHVQALEHRLDALRETAAQRREDRMALLEEALKVAEVAGLEQIQATMWQAFTGTESSAGTDAPLYLLGAEAIRAELEVLRKRQSDDPFIPELRPLQEQLAFLKGIDIEPENVSVFTLDSPALVPETPIRPKKRLIMGLGLVLGGMLGVFFALVRSLYSQRFAKGLSSAQAG